MKALIIAITLILGVIRTTATEPGKTDIPSEHKPFFAWIKAIKEADLETFKTVYSKRMQKKMARKGWEKVLEKSKNGFNERIGDYKQEDFTIKFQAGKENKGKLLIKFKGKDFPKLDIIKEDGNWKINEY